MKKVVVGIDIGGTNTAFGLVCEQGEILAQGRIPTGQYSDLGLYFEALSSAIGQLIRRSGDELEVIGVGIGAPNANYYRGTIEHAPNLPWKGTIPFVGGVRRHFPTVPVLMTNDAALIALVPVTLTVLALCGLEKSAALIIILQTLAANIGSGLTPIGNPQNLFLYLRYGFTLPDFFLTMLPFMLLGGALLLVCCAFIPNAGVNWAEREAPRLNVRKGLAYAVLFLLSVMTVMGFLHPALTLPACVITAAVTDRKVLAVIFIKLTEVK